jgi:hypothetical protein
MAKLVKSVEITEENCKLKLFEYAMQRYWPEMKNAIPQCPYDLGELATEQAFKEVAEWFISERIHPSTGKTVVREFVENCKGDMESGLGERLLQMEAMFHGEFEILVSSGNQVTLADIASGERYNVKLFDGNRAIFKVGRII